MDAHSSTVSPTNYNHVRSANCNFGDVSVPTNCSFWGVPPANRCHGGALTQQAQHLKSPFLVAEPFVGEFSPCHSSSWILTIWIHMILGEIIIFMCFSFSLVILSYCFAIWCVAWFHVRYLQGGDDPLNIFSIIGADSPLAVLERPFWSAESAGEWLCWWLMDG